jgi:hypothetical protein
MTGRAPATTTAGSLASKAFWAQTVETLKQTPEDTAQANPTAADRN